MRLKIEPAAVKVAPGLLEKRRAHIEGQASGHFDYTSTGTGLETRHGDGDISFAGPMSARGQAQSRRKIEVECDGVFRLTGTLTIAADQALSGQVKFGLPHPYLVLDL